MVATRHFQRIIFADSHVMEPLDLWWNALGQTFGDRTPGSLTNTRTEGTFFYSQPGPAGGRHPGNATGDRGCRSAAEAKG